MATMKLSSAIELVLNADEETISNIGKALRVRAALRSLDLEEKKEEPAKRLPAVTEHRDFMRHVYEWSSGTAFSSVSLAYAIGAGKVPAIVGFTSTPDGVKKYLSNRKGLHYQTIHGRLEVQSISASTDLWKISKVSPWG